MRILRLISFFIFGLVANNLIAADRPLDDEALVFQNLLFDSEFQKLSDLADQYRNDPSLVSMEGMPMLVALYAGISACIPKNCKVSDSEWTYKYNQLRAWQAQLPNSITPKIAIAGYYVSHAWLARGRGYANTVTPEGWQIFQEYMVKADDQLKKISGQGKLDPKWYDLMLDVGLAQKWPIYQYDTIYNEGVIKFPYYFPLYFNKATYLAPRWYGSPKLVNQYVEKTVSNQSDEEFANTLYARINWSAQSNDMFTDGQTDWQKMKVGFDQVVKDFPHPWNVNNYAKFACKAQDYPTAYKVSQSIKDSILISAWGSGGKGYFEWCYDYGDLIVNGSRPAGQSPFGTVK
ncbi:hypothetical protein [Sessilibacter sp. MAH4]